jgi:hypothetical protein
MRRAALAAVAVERTDLMVARTKTTPDHGAELNKTEARQGTRPRAMLWVLVGSLVLAAIVGLALGLGWISLPWSSVTTTP